jgi:DNA-binding MarR family transcriptional regulator
METEALSTENQAIRIMNLVSRLSHLLQKRASRELGKVGLKAVDYIVLKTVSSETVTPNKLAERLGITKAAVTYIVDRLEGYGLVRRERKPYDRRAYTIVVTKKGKRVLVKAERLYLKILERELSSLSQQKVTMLYQGLEELVRQFSSTRE